MNTDLSRYAKLIGLYHGKWYDVQLIIWNKRGIYATLLNGYKSPIRVKNPIFKEGIEQVELPNLPRIEVEDGF